MPFYHLVQISLHLPVQHSSSFFFFHFSFIAGGMFTYVSGANFFGEIVEWIGFALACWSLPSLSFALFTAFNIGPRAIQHHKYVDRALTILCRPNYFFFGGRG